MSAIQSIQSNCGICPTCNRKLPQAKVSDKKLSEDIRKAESAIAVLSLYIGTDSLGEACLSESIRLQRAITDHGLLWSIYRRRDKASGYGISLVRKTRLVGGGN